MQFIMIADVDYPVAFDYSDDHGTTVETDAACAECGPETDWHYSQLCEAGYPSVVECWGCGASHLVQDRKDEAK